MPIVDGTAETPGDEERLRQRQEGAPGTATPGEAHVAIVCFARRVRRDTEMKARRSNPAQEGRRGEQEFQVDGGAGFDVVAQEANVVRQHTEFALVNPPLRVGVS